MSRRRDAQFHRLIDVVRAEDRDLRALQHADGRERAAVEHHDARVFRIRHVQQLVAQAQPHGAAKRIGCTVERELAQLGRARRGRIGQIGHDHPVVAGIAEIERPAAVMHDIRQLRERLRKPQIGGRQLPLHGVRRGDGQRALRAFRTVGIRLVRAVREGRADRQHRGGQQAGAQQRADQPPGKTGHTRSSFPAAVSRGKLDDTGAQSFMPDDAMVSMMLL